MPTNHDVDLLENSVISLHGTLSVVLDAISDQPIRENRDSVPVKDLRDIAETLSIVLTLTRRADRIARDRLGYPKNPADH